MAFFDDGTYDVKFLIETPDMPLSLRLQLRVAASADKCSDKKCKAEIYTLTLPPISIPAR